MRMRRCQSMELARYYKRLENIEKRNKKMRDTLKTVLWFGLSVVWVFFAAFNNR